MYQLHILSRAEEDMKKSSNWYNDKQAGLGDRFLKQVVRTFKLIETNPLLYQEKFSKKFRFALIQDFLFVVVFKIKQRSVIINAVFHTSRNSKRFV